MPHRVLVVEDELLVGKSIVARLEREGFAAESVGTAAEARAAMADDWDLILLGMRLPDCHGLGLLHEIRAEEPDQVVLMMASHSAVEDAVEAIKLGAHGYVIKPFEPDELLLRIRKAFESTLLRRELLVMRERYREGAGLESLVGESPEMLSLKALIREVAAGESSTVLISGECSVGKETVAKAIHYSSRRASGPYLAVSCVSSSEAALESEIFGDEKGAARHHKKGLLELAEGGTLFLDEIGDLTQPLQARLLHVLQEKTFRRVGGNRDMRSDVRIIAATEQSVRHLVEKGTFRQDLYHRLRVTDILVPPLRARSSDIALLARSFVTVFNKELRRNVTGLSREALAKLLGYSWPGNVRELKNVVERAMMLGRGDEIQADDLAIPPAPQGEASAAPAIAPTTTTPSGRLRILAGCPAPKPGASAVPAEHAERSGGESGDAYHLPAGGVDLDRLEREFVLQAIEAAHGNKTRAGRLLGLNRDQVRYRLEKYGLIESHGRPRSGASDETAAAPPS